MLTTVQTSMIIPASHATLGCTAKQIAWLKYAEKEYNIKIEFNFKNRVDASNEISRIQGLINSGKLTKSVAPVISHTWYVVVDTTRVIGNPNNISIKTFTGSKIEASAKARAIYGQDVKFASTEIEESKAKAIELRNNLIADEVATTLHDNVNNVNATTSTDAELTMDALNALSIEDLRKLASDMGVELGRSKKRETIIARILA